MPDIDIDQTDVVVKLFETPPPQRDQAWMRAFFAAAPTAAFHVQEGEEVFTGPDGFHYLRLTVPPADKEFRGYSIKHLLNQAIEQGVGAVIFPEDQSQPMWVFTYGHLLSYKICGEFDARGPKLETELPPTERKVLISQPNEDYLPTPARKIIRKYLQLNGVGVPAMFMLHDTSMQPPQQLAFNLFRENFPNDQHFGEVCQRLTWFLPPHYSFVVVPKGNAQFDGAFAKM